MTKLLGKLFPSLFTSAAPAVSAGGGEAIGTLTTAIAGLAGGGDMTAGNSYIVGENGPEILSGVSGHVTSHTQSERMFSSSRGTTQINHIDARGSDLGAGNRVQRAMEVTHNAAVSNGIRAQYEHAQRTPAGKH